MRVIRIVRSPKLQGLFGLLRQLGIIRLTKCANKPNSLCLIACIICAENIYARERARMY
jgi:hypothetical protein